MDEGLTQAAPADLGALPELVRKPSVRYGLEVVIADGIRRIFELHEGPNTLGRAAECDVTLNDLLVSRRHALLTVAEKVVLEDVGSDNGIVMGGQKIVRAELEAGATFKLGPRIEAKLVHL